MDDEGYVKIVGRIKDMIIRGGENVYPREIEEFLYTPSRRRRRPGRSACPTSATARRSWPGCSCARARASTEDELARVLPRPDRPLQDPALRRVRRRVPDDRHRQGPEVRAARAARSRSSASRPTPACGPRERRRRRDPPRPGRQPRPAVAVGHEHLGRRARPGLGDRPRPRAGRARGRGRRRRLRARRSRRGRPDPPPRRPRRGGRRPARRHPHRARGRRAR